MKRLALLAVALLALPVFWISSPVANAAKSPFAQVDCSGNPNNQSDPASSAYCQDYNNNKNNGKNPLTGPNGLIMKIVNIVALIAGVAAVIIIILAGLRFIQSGGNSEDVAGARRALIYAVVGIIVIILARFLIALILKGL